MPNNLDKEKDVIYAYVHDKTLKDNNGGSLVLYHHLLAFKELGYKIGRLLNLDEEVPEDATYIMWQSEWWNVIKGFLSRTSAKKICWLGHYNTHPRYGMPPIGEINADFFHTQYKGEAVNWGENIVGQEILYLPHAGCTVTDVSTGIAKTPSRVFIGNSFPEREENWLTFAGVQMVQKPFLEIQNIYHSAIVCPNIHGDFQKGIACEFFQTPAEMINERIFQVILAGGFCVSDNTPIVRDFFTEDEVPIAENKEDFKEIIDHFVAHPDDRLPYMEKAKAHIMKEHLYIHRIKKLIEMLCEA